MRRGSLRRRKADPLRQQKPPKRFTFSVIIIAAIGSGCVIAPQRAPGFPTNADMRSVGGESVGFPIHTFFEKPIPALAREMLLQRHLDGVTPGTPGIRRGVAVELFAPGDAGITLRYRW